MDRTRTNDKKPSTNEITPKFNKAAKDEEKVQEQGFEKGDATQEFNRVASGVEPEVNRPEPRLDMEPMHQGPAGPGMGQAPPEHMPIEAQRAARIEEMQERLLTSEFNRAARKQEHPEPELER